MRDILKAVDSMLYSGTSIKDITGESIISALREYNTKVIRPNKAYYWYYCEKCGGELTEVFQSRGIKIEHCPQCGRRIENE